MHTFEDKKVQQIKREGSIQGEGGLYRKLKIPTLPPKLQRSGVTFHYTIVLIKQLVQPFHVKNGLYSLVFETLLKNRTKIVKIKHKLNHNVQYSNGSI